MNLISINLSRLITRLAALESVFCSILYPGIIWIPVSLPRLMGTLELPNPISGPWVLRSYPTQYLDLERYKGPTYNLTSHTDTEKSIAPIPQNLKIPTANIWRHLRINHRGKTWNKRRKTVLLHACQ